MSCSLGSIDILLRRLHSMHVNTLPSLTKYAVDWDQKLILILREGYQPYLHFNSLTVTTLRSILVEQHDTTH